MQLPGFSIFQTILTAVTTALVSLVIIPKYYTPYANFKQELIITYRYLQLHSNILTNEFQKDEIDTEFKKKVHDVQYDIRIAWSNLESKYLLIPKESRYLFIMFGMLPPKDKMNEISGELLFISNCSIIVDKDKRIAEDSLKNRYRSIEKVKEFIKQYGAS